MNWVIRSLLTLGLAGACLAGWWAAGSRRLTLQPPAAEASEVRRPPRATSIRLLAVGDLMLGTSVARLIRSEGPDYPFRHARHVLSEPEITFGNLETAVSSRGRPTPGKSRDSLRRGTNYIFRAPPSCCAGLARAGFDVVSLANNHAMDFCGEALLDTLRHLREAGVEPVGGGANLQEAFAPVTVARDGIRVAFIGISDILPALCVAGRAGPGIAPAPRGRRSPHLEAAIRSAKEQADYVVVAVHWGIERMTRPSARQKSLGHALIRSGADLVIGSHPHVLQPVERYRRGLIHYSLGNFVTYISKTQRTEALEITLRPGKALAYRRIPFSIRGGQAVPG